MKKIIVSSIILFSLTQLSADGLKVFKEKCSTCHAQEMTKSFAMKNLMTLKAPPMVEVSNKIKDNIKIVEGDSDIKRAVVVAFIKDYVINPTIFHSMCEAFPLEHFGVMPSMKGKITQSELDEVSEWVYDYYEGKKF